MRITHPVLRAVLVLILLGVALISVGSSRAQTSTGELKPSSVTLDSGAFEKQTAGDPAQGSAVANTPMLESDPVAAPTPFTDMMVRLQAITPPATTVAIEVRASNDGRTWTPWGEAHISDNLADADDPPNVHWSGTIYAGPSRFYQVRALLTASPDGILPTIENVQVHTVDARDAVVVSEQPIRSGMVSSSSIARPAYVSRTAWGNPQGESALNAPPSYYTANHLIVHHTADSNTLTPNEPNWAARVRAEWSFHTYSRGWGDIGYNWLIDPNGVVYAGRAGSPNGDAVGFHDTANYGSMGAVFIGTYTSVPPTSAAQNSMVDVLAWKASQRGIDPLGRSWYYGCSKSQYCAPFNAGSVVPNIAGHREVTPGHTTCPGDQGMEVTQSLRQRVYQRLHGADPTGDNGDLTIDERETSFSKTGDWYDRACGFGDHTYYTYGSNTSDNVTNTNRGTWTPTLPRAGYYTVRASIPQGCSIRSGVYATATAKYEIVHAQGRTEKTIDHHTAQAWVDLGTFLFNEGRNGNVTLTDLTQEPFSDKRVVFFDAVQWVYQGPPPGETPVVSAQLLSAKVRNTVVPTGGLVYVEFTIKNTGTAVLDTQAPDASDAGGAVNGWTYNEWECFLGDRTPPPFPKQVGRLRTALGFAAGSTTVAQVCSGDDGGYPWRWGLRSPLQPGETRTIDGTVRFHTRGTYTLTANLVNEYVTYYGSDGKGRAVQLASITVKDFPYKAFLPQSWR
jgi:hypothetical protein